MTTVADALSPSTLSALSQANSTTEQVNDTPFPECLEPLSNQHSSCSIFPACDQVAAITSLQADLSSQHVDVNANFSPLFDLDIENLPQPAQPEVDSTLISDFLHSLDPDPLAIDAEKASKLACLEALKQQRNYIQDWIHLL